MNILHYPSLSHVFENPALLKFVKNLNVETLSHVNELVKSTGLEGDFGGAKRLFYRKTDQNKVVCRDILTLILEHPNFNEKAVEKALDDISKNILSGDLRFAYQLLSSKKGQETHYFSAPEEDRQIFADKDIITRTYNPQKRIVAQNAVVHKRVHAMSQQHYNMVMSSTLSQIKKLSITLRLHEESNKARQEKKEAYPIKGKVERETSRKVKEPSKTAQSLFSSSLNRKEEYKQEKKDEQRYEEVRELRKKRKEEKIAKSEREKELAQLQEESKALKKGKPAPVGRSFHTKKP